MNHNKVNQSFELPNTFVKNVAIQLPDNFKLNNNPFEINNKNTKTKSSSKNFIGRESEISKFKSFLDSSKKGVFLVTGYRGMGKTSFVNYVVDKYIKDHKQKKDKIIPIHLTLAQSKPREFEVLRQIVNSIYDSFGQKKSKIIEILEVVKYILIALLIIITLLKIVFIRLYIHDDNFEFIKENLNPAITLSIIIVSIFAIFIFEKVYYIQNKAFHKIANLMERCHATISEERIQDPYMGIISSISEFTTGKSNPNKKNKHYSIADSKIIEYELIQFLIEAKKDKYEFFFIFDELDKIELHNDSWNINEDLESYESRVKDRSPNHSLRNRKKVILNIITGLKNFFTTANARFIFIAGREMFDASLADIADKQSPLSSVFTYVFHIESLLKERGSGEDLNIFSLGIIVENFLKQQLFTKEQIFDTEKNKEYSFDDLLRKHFFRPYEKTDAAGFMQIYFLLHGLINYLVYRSSGSPKKLIKTFQEFVNFENSLINSKFITHRSIHGNSVKYLYFSYNNQYKIGFIQSIYRPFIINYGRQYKSFSENTVISIPYFFDYLFKFHPFAFSMSNLELIPDLLSSNKTHYLKNDLKQVVNYLYQSHIRDTDIELFDYKFYSKTANEINYISRIFEAEAAAFNFTLDESYSLKSLIIERVKELRSIHSKYNLDPLQLSPQIFSIANLNSNLGDVYFFDQEFDDAINSYSDAIRPINNLVVDKLNLRDFIYLIRNKLKVGLCFEKINSFEEALAFYSDSVNDIKRYFSYNLKNSKFIFFDDVNVYNDKSFYFSSMNDLLQICVQSFLANLFIQEKMGLEGTSTGKAKLAFSDFFKIVYEIGKHSGTNHMILSNSMLHYGNLLYYKNSSQHSIQNENNSKPLYPEEFSVRVGLFGHYFGNVIEPSKRQPLLSFFYYMIGLDEVMQTREYFIKNNKKKHDFLYATNKGKVVFLNEYLIKINNVLIECPVAINKNQSHEQHTAFHLKYMANFTSNIGNCILGMYDLKTKYPKNSKMHSHWVEKEEIIEFLNQIESGDLTIANTARQNFKMGDVLTCYFIAAKMYEKYGRISSAIFEYRKILQVIMTVLPNNDVLKGISNNKFIKELQNKIVNPVKELINISNNRTERHMILKLERMISKVGKHNPEIANWPIEYSIANAAELKEIDLLFECIIIKEKVKSINVNKLVNSNSTILTQHLRISELDFYCRYITLEISKQLKLVRSTKTFKYDRFNNNLVKLIFCKNSILRILKIYETDYMFGPSYTAHIHNSITTLLETELFFTDQLKPIKIGEYLKRNDLNQNFDFRMTLNNLLGGKSTTLFDSDYHLGMAKDFYTKTVQLHTAGMEYRRQIKDMIYLEDDFNDNAYHFGAAIERYLLVNDVFNKKIKSINQKLIKKN